MISLPSVGVLKINGQSWIEAGPVRPSNKIMVVDEEVQWTLNEGTLNLTQTKFHTIQGHSRGNMTGLDLGYIIVIGAEAPDEIGGNGPEYFSENLPVLPRSVVPKLKSCIRNRVCYQLILVYLCLVAIGDRCWSHERSHIGTGFAILRWDKAKMFSE